MSNSGIDVSGGTYQITFQLNGTGAALFTHTMDVDNLTLTMVPEPSAMALVGLVVPALILSLRRK